MGFDAIVEALLPVTKGLTSTERRRRLASFARNRPWIVLVLIVVGAVVEEFIVWPSTLWGFDTLQVRTDVSHSALVRAAAGVCFWLGWIALAFRTAINAELRVEGRKPL